MMDSPPPLPEEEPRSKTNLEEAATSPPSALREHQQQTRATRQPRTARSSSMPHIIGGAVILVVVTLILVYLFKATKPAGGEGAPAVSASSAEPVRRADILAVQPSFAAPPRDGLEAPGVVSQQDVSRGLAGLRRRIEEAASPVSLQCEGVIHSYPVRMSLSFSSGQVSGTYYYIRSGAANPLRLTGSYGNGLLDLNEYDAENNLTGVFALQIGLHEITGLWTAARSGRTFRVSLRES